MNIKAFFIFVLISFSFLASTAQKFIVNGYVTDASNNEKLIGATILNTTDSIVKLSNEFGYFNIQFKDKSKENLLQISFIGYQTQTFKVEKDTNINVRLIEDNTIEQVNVLSEKALSIEKRNEISTLTISRSDLKLLPTFGGESDIFKAFQMMPGIQKGKEGKTGMYVRGGSPDQNLILLDDVPLYNVNHLGGFIGIFNSDIIQDSKLIKGGFPAQYGGRLSSVLDVRTRNGNSIKKDNSYTLGLLSSKLSFEGPISKGKSSYLISARRFMYDLALYPLVRFTTKSWYGYSFYDINFKLNHILNQKNHFYLSIYSGRDAIYINTSPQEKQIHSIYKNKWGNDFASFRWNHIFSNKLFVNSTFYASQYSYLKHLKTNDKNIDMNSSNKDFSKLYDVSLKLDFEYSYLKNFTLKTGFHNSFYLTEPFITKTYTKIGNEVPYDTTYLSKNYKILSNSFYLENQFSIASISGNIGIRLSNYWLSEKNYFYIEPRVLVHYLISNNYKLSLSYAKMQQNVHLIPSTSMGLSGDYWMPSTENIPPAESNQYTLGIATTISNALEISVESFYKTMKHLITFNENISYFSINNDWEKLIEKNGKGEVYGLEFLLQKKQGDITGWFAYTWSKNFRHFENINQGDKYYFEYDRPHEINIVFNYKINKKISFSATWVFASGEAMTYPDTKYSIPSMTLNQITNTNQTAYYFSSKNATRGLSYHKLDIGFNFYKERTKGIRIWNLSIYNLYNRLNPYIYLPRISTNQNSGVLSTISAKGLFPIMPSFSYTYKF